MMRRFCPGFRFWKWAVLALFVPFAVSFIASMRWQIFYVSPDASARFDEGILTLTWGFPRQEPFKSVRGWSAREMQHRTGFRFLFPRMIDASSGGTIVDFPLWCVTLPLGIATGLLWYADRKRTPPGHCRRCGYNLHGNTSGRCPECGEACELATTDP